MRSKNFPMFRINQSEKNESAVSALIGVILIVFLVLALTAVMSVIFLGLLSGPIQKSAYIVAEGTSTNISGYPVITLRHLQGDVGHLSGTGAGYPIKIQVSSGGQSGTAVPDPAGIVWSPATILYIYRNSTGYQVTNDTTRMIPGQPLPFSGTDMTVSVIDTTNEVLVYSWSGAVTGGNITSSRGPGFSVYGWLRFTSPPAPSASNEQWATMVVDGNTDSNRRFHIQHDQQNTRFEFVFRTAQMASANQQARWVQSSSGPAINQWYHIAGVYNQTDGRARLYVNGVESASLSLDKSGVAPSPGFYQVGGPSGVTFSGTPGMRRLRGNVNGVSTANQAIFGPEILSLYQAGHP